MSKSTPSLLALLGLVAVAGYQNRSRLTDMLADARKNLPAQDADNRDSRGVGNVIDANRLAGFMSEIGRLFKGGTTGGALSGGLNDLLERFRSSGRSEPAESWVSDGPNMPIDVEELRSVLGDDALRELSQKTGMTQDQLLLRLNAALPDVVNQFTPAGRVPDQYEAQALV